MAAGRGNFAAGMVGGHGVTKVRPWHRYYLFAVAASADPDDLEGSSELADVFNEVPKMYVFQRSAKTGARFMEEAVGSSLRFYVLPVARPPREMED